MSSTAETNARWDSQALGPWTSQFARGETLTLEGLQSHYRVQGEGPPLILLHGFFFDSELWGRNIDTLARTHRVHALDLWGFGYSARIMQPSYAHYARQVAAFMTALGIERAAFIGHSLGGGIAMYFSVHHPERVSALVLVGSAGMRNPEPLAARSLALPGIGELLLKLPGDGLRKKMLRDFFFCDPRTLTAAAFTALTRHQKIRGSAASALALMRGGFADRLEGLLPRLAALRLPILIVWGEQDRAIPLALGERLHRALPGSTLCVIPDAGHAPNFEQPDRFNAAVTAFLGKHPGPAGPDRQCGA